MIVQRPGNSRSINQPSMVPSAGRIGSRPRPGIAAAGIGAAAGAGAIGNGASPPGATAPASAAVPMPAAAIPGRGREPIRPAEGTIDGWLMQRLFPGR